MKLTQIEYFLKVAEKLSYTAAARELYLSQPALSKQISLLEEALGVRLFKRDNKHVELTAAGKKLQLEMEPLVREMAAVIEGVKAMGSQEKKIRIGCFDGLDTQSILEDVEGRLMESGAETVEFMLYEVQELKERLHNGELDFGIIPDFSLPYFGEVEARTLETRRGAIIYSYKHPLAGKKRLAEADFCGMTFISIEDRMTPGATERLGENLRRCGITPGKIILAPNMMTVASYIDRGLGLCILSRDVIRNKENKWKAFELTGEAVPLKVTGIREKAHKSVIVDKLFSSYNLRLSYNNY